MVTFMSASRITLPPFQYSRGGFIVLPLRDTLAAEEEVEESREGRGSAVEMEKRVVTNQNTGIKTGVSNNQ